MDLIMIIAYLALLLDIYITIYAAITLKLTNFNKNISLINFLNTYNLNNYDNLYYWLFLKIKNYS